MAGALLLQAATTPDWLAALARFLAQPVVAPLLLALGVLGIIVELKAGAFGLGLLVSLVSLGLFFGASVTAGLAGWHEIVLLGVGAIALAVEVFVLPGFGAAGILGAVCFAAAAVLAMVGTAPTTGDVAGAVAALGASVVITAAVAYAWVRHLPNSSRFKGLLLRDGLGAGQGYLAAPQRHEVVGRDGVAVTDLRPSGAAQVGDERLDVVTEGEFIAQGSRILVVRADGYRHVVRAAS